MMPSSRTRLRLRFGRHGEAGIWASGRRSSIRCPSPAGNAGGVDQGQIDGDAHANGASRAAGRRGTPGRGNARHSTIAPRPAEGIEDPEAQRAGASATARASAAAASLVQIEAGVAVDRPPATLSACVGERQLDVERRRIDAYQAHGRGRLPGLRCRRASSMAAADASGEAAAHRRSAGDAVRPRAVARLAPPPASPRAGSAAVDRHAARGPGIRPARRQATASRRVHPGPPAPRARSSPRGAAGWRRRGLARRLLAAALERLAAAGGTRRLLPGGRGQCRGAEALPGRRPGPGRPPPGYYRSEGGATAALVLALAIDGADQGPAPPPANPC